jgi:hypothetical protein
VAPLENIYQNVNSVNPFDVTLFASLVSTISGPVHSKCDLKINKDYLNLAEYRSDTIDLIYLNTFN